MRKNSLYFVLLIILNTNSVNLWGQEKNNPLQAIQLKKDIKQINKQIQSIKEKQWFFTSVALVSMSMLYYLPERFTSDFSFFHLLEAFVRSTVLVAGGNCGKQGYELHKTSLLLQEKKNSLIASLQSIKNNTLYDKETCSTTVKENILFSCGLFLTLGLWYYLPIMCQQDYSPSHLTEAAVRTGAATIGGNCLVEFYESRKSRLKTNKSEFVLPIQKKDTHSSPKPPVLDLTKLSSEYSGEYGNIARLKRHNSLPSPRKSNEFDDKS